jgi:hypothetical protein
VRVGDRIPDHANLLASAYRVPIISQPICAKRLVIPAISVPLGFVRAD